MRKSINALLQILAIVFVFALLTRGDFGRAENCKVPPLPSNPGVPVIGFTAYSDCQWQVNSPNETGYGDADYTLGSDWNIYIAQQLSTTRTWPLPPAGTVPAGRTVTITDPKSYVTITNNLVVQVPFGSGDNINGSPSPITLRAPLSWVRLTSDGVENWSATTVVPPSAEISLAQFGPKTAKVLNDSNCTFMKPNSLQCTRATFNQTDVDDQDQVVGQYVGSGHSLYLGHVHALVAGHSDTVTLDTTLSYDSPSQIVPILHVAGSGSGYSFGSLQTLNCPWGSCDSRDVSATGTPGVMTITATQVNNSGSGGPTSGTCTLTLSPTSSQALAGVQATFTAHWTTGHVMTSADVFQGGNYLALSSSYTYDANGYYDAVPVVPVANTGCDGLTGAALNISFGVVEEVIQQVGIYYDSGTPSCAASALTMSTNDNGGLLTPPLSVTCDNNPPLATPSHQDRTSPAFMLRVPPPSPISGSPAPLATTLTVLRVSGCGSTPAGPDASSTWLATPEPIISSMRTTRVSLTTPSSIMATIRR